MRPHVELIQEADYIWHPAEITLGEGKAVQRNLSVDEEDGSASTKIDFLSDFGKPAGYHHADTEWYVLEGEVEIGDHKMGPGGYFWAGKDIWTPHVKAKEGTKILLYREFGDWGFDAADQGQNRNGAAESLIVDDTNKREWEQVVKEGPAAGLWIKMLHRDPKTGFYSRLIWAQPGWTDERLAHHHCYEEAYTIAGDMVYNFGDLVVGTYFFRPPFVKHGHFISGEREGCTWLIRSDGDLVNMYTINERVEVYGDALNYGDHEKPVLSSLPVRSRTPGPWSGDGM